MIHFGPGMLVSGRLACSGAVVLNCRLEGSISCPSLHIGADGYLVGSAEADDVVVDGQVVGDIRARSVTLNATAVVEGDIRHQSLSKHRGAVLVGRSQQSAEWAACEEAEALRLRQEEIAGEIDDILHDSLCRQRLTERRKAISYKVLPARVFT